jgi:SET domain-containing protein
MYLTRLFKHYSKLTEVDEYIFPCASIRYSNKINGRGVFSNVEYNKNDIIEIAPAIQHEYKLNIGKVSDYTFALNDDTVLIGFGYASMYNHSDKPNAYYDYIDGNKIKIVCIKKILPNEEIFVSYGKKYFENRSYIDKL